MLAEEGSLRAARREGLVSRDGQACEGTRTQLEEGEGLGRLLGWDMYSGRKSASGKPPGREAVWGWEAASKM